MSSQILRLPEVSRQTGLPRSSIYALIAKNEFPSPVKLSQRSVGWVESEITTWIEDRIAVTRAGDRDE